MKPFDKRQKSRSYSPGRPQGRRHEARRGERHEERGDGPLRLFGVHAVEAALANPSRVILRLMATENGENRLKEVIAKRGAAVESASPRDLDNILGPDTVHQGVMLETEPLPEPSVEDLAERAVSGGPLVILDHVTDPHNVGAILRSCAVFGAAGLVMTRRHSPPLNGVLAKSASGALDLVPVALVQNLARTMAELKEQGIRMVGLDGEAEARLEDESFSGPSAIVLGAEGRGLRDLTRETCDKLVKIATAGPIASLNVSNAAAVALHVAVMRRGG